MGARVICCFTAICMLLAPAMVSGPAVFAQETAMIALMWNGATVVAQQVSKETLVGVVDEGEYGLELRTKDLTYVLEDYLPEDLLGRKVKITGAVEEGEDGTMFLSVDTFEPVE